MNEEEKTKAEFEEQAAAAEIYFEDILSKLTPEQRVESARLMMMKYDQTNPLLSVFNKIPYVGAKFEADIHEVNFRALDYAKFTWNMDDHGCYALKCLECDSKLSFCKVLKDYTGLGLKETKDIVDCTPGIFVYNLSYTRATILSKHLIENVTGCKFELQIGIVN